MNKRTAVLAALLALAATPTAAQESAKIGFVATFSGPAAGIGNDMRDGFELALDHLGARSAGSPAHVIYEDDQQKPEVGKQKTDKLIGADRVSFLTGYIWSNVLLASLKPAVDAQTFLISANAGPSQIAGELCSPWFFSVSWQGDQVPQAIGEYLNQKGVKSAFLIAPNYAAGKDVIAGLKANFKGTVAGEEYTKWPDQLDFSVELARRAPPSRMPSSRSIPAPPASSFSPNTPRPALRRRSRSTPPSSSTPCRCRGSASLRSAFPAPSTG
jgi:branched-chain amino acid transport system substrate-binding protein